MKSRLLTIILMLISIFCSIKPLQQEEISWASLKEMPAEVKLMVISKLLEQPSLITIINSLNGLRLVDKEFYEILSAEDIFRPFFELSSIESGSNIFDVLKFIKAQPILLQYPDLANYLHTKFTYFPIDVIQSGLNLLDPVKMDAYKNKMGRRFGNALHFAILNQNLKAIFELLLAGANAQEIRAHGISPIVDAVGSNNYAIVKLLLDKGTNPNTKAYIGWLATPLSVAIKNQNYDIAQLLLAHGADPIEAEEANPNKARQDSPLQLAIEAQNLELVQLLIDYGAQVDIEFPLGFSPLMYAAKAKNKDLVMLLIDNNADISDEFLIVDFENIEKNPYLIAEQRAEWLAAYEFLRQVIANYYPEESL